MKAQEFITEESYLDPGIKRVLSSKGYKFLGQGIDQAAYLAPDGSVLKIFGASRGGHRGFELFVNYCKKHPNNPFLPQFSDWSRFKYNDETYLQIRMERLFPIPYEINDALERIAIQAKYSKSPSKKEKYIDTVVNPQTERAQNAAESFQLLIGLIGKDGFNLLWDTIYDLNAILLDFKYSPSGNVSSANLDLHSGNFMLGSDGQPVILDPFYID